MSKLRFGLIVIIGSVIFALCLILFSSPRPQPQNQPVSTQSSLTSQNSDLIIEDLVVGDGPEVKAGDTITIHYLGTLNDGTKFDSSYDRDQPFQTQIGVGQVIAGWDQGVIGMKVGGKRKLTIPPGLGYGDNQAGSIPPNSILIFELELLSIQ